MELKDIDSERTNSTGIEEQEPAEQVSSNSWDYYKYDSSKLWSASERSDIEE